MHHRVGSILWLGILVGIAALVAVGLWQVQGDNPLLFALESRPERIMGTESLLKVVVPADQTDVGEHALEAGEQALRRVEGRMSRRLRSSDISRLNAAEAGQLVPLSRQTVEVLSLARALSDQTVLPGQTTSAFDVTSAPVFALWRACGRANRLPTPEELARARELSGWKHFQLQDDAVLKLQTGSMVDLGGIAKGYGIDRAVAAMQAQRVSGGLVNVGGDIRCFGTTRHGGPWTISIRDPFPPEQGQQEAKPLGIVFLRAGAVCTSGNYMRYEVIDGKRYSHIIDPRTGQPVDLAPSVTVVAPEAAAADAWATGLSVLGRDGLDLIAPNSGIEAMLVVGTPEDYQIFKTDGFNELLKREKPGLPATAQVTTRNLE